MISSYIMTKMDDGLTGEQYSTLAIIQEVN